MNNLYLLTRGCQILVKSWIMNKFRFAEHRPWSIILRLGPGFQYVSRRKLGQGHLKDINYVLLYSPG